MGLLGTLLFPDDPTTAWRLDEAQDALERTNALHTSLVNSFRAAGESIRTFDACLMALLVMHYHLAYAAEDLAALADTGLPKLSNACAVRAERAAADAITMRMAVDGVKALKARVLNIYKEGGIVRKAAAEADRAVGARLNGEVDSIVLRTALLRSAIVEVLTTAKRGDELRLLSAELAAEAGGVAATVKAARGVGPAISAGAADAAALAHDGAGAAGAGANAAAAPVAVGEGVTSGAPAVLGPALSVIAASAALLSTVHAEARSSQLAAAAGAIDDLQHRAGRSVADLTQLLKILLRVGKASLDAYNALLPILQAIDAPSRGGREVATSGVQAYADAMAGVATASPSALDWDQATTLQHLDDAIGVIREHARHEGLLTRVVTRMRTEMRQRNLDDLDDKDPCLIALAREEGLQTKAVQHYNQFRRQVASLAAVLKPYHDEIAHDTPFGSALPVKPSVPRLGTPDPAFDARPRAFTMPAPGGAAAAGV
jgi:hypothetical protein